MSGPLVPTRAMPTEDDAGSRDLAAINGYQVVYVRPAKRRKAEYRGDHALGSSGMQASRAVRPARACSQRHGIQPTSEATKPGRSFGEGQAWT